MDRSCPVVGGQRKVASIRITVNSMTLHLSLRLLRCPLTVSGLIAEDIGPLSVCAFRSTLPYFVTSRGTWVVIRNFSVGCTSGHPSYGSARSSSSWIRDLLSASHSSKPSNKQYVIPALFSFAARRKKAYVILALLR
jgi:hypothetical protein